MWINREKEKKDKKIKEGRKSSRIDFYTLLWYRKVMNWLRRVRDTYERYMAMPRLLAYYIPRIITRGYQSAATETDSQYKRRREEEKKKKDWPTSVRLRFQGPGELLGSAANKGCCPGILYCSFSVGSILLLFTGWQRYESVIYLWQFFIINFCLNYAKKNLSAEKTQAGQGPWFSRTNENQEWARCVKAAAQQGSL